MDEIEELAKLLYKMDCDGIGYEHTFEATREGCRKRAEIIIKEGYFKIQEDKKEILSSYVEISLCNYNEDDIGRLQAWASEAYDYISHFPAKESEKLVALDYKSLLNIIDNPPLEDAELGGIHKVKSWVCVKSPNLAKYIVSKFGNNRFPTIDKTPQNIAIVWNDIKKYFYRKFTKYYPNNTGIGGSEPQEENREWICEPSEVLEFIAYLMIKYGENLSPIEKPILIEFFKELKISPEFHYIYADKIVSRFGVPELPSEEDKHETT